MNPKQSELCNNAHDAYKPAVIAALIEGAGVAKARLTLGQMLTLAMLAGAEVPLAGALGNLFWVTLGNILGGAGGVAMAYRYAYLGGKGS